ncbi:MAG: 3-phosphoshikimate 1-carboxyvinyltransferase [Armatimonadota bacterium]
MRLLVHNSTLTGAAAMPGSKSHTIRAVMIASLAEGQSRIIAPLDSLDTQAAVTAGRAFGAEMELGQDWIVQGVAGQPQTPENVVDIGNSGTTMFIAIGLAALGEGYTVLTGDEQIRSRPAQGLLEALNELGAECFSTRGNGCAPLVIKGRLRGGAVEIDCPISQYLTSPLIACPLGEGDTEITVPRLNEQPYAEMTLSWLDRRGIQYEREGMRHFRIPGAQRYEAFEERIPADFSSATFFLCAAALVGEDVLLEGLDMEDVQGDKLVVDMLREMGADITVEPEGIRVRAAELRGAEFDLNATPDALPSLAVVGCFAEGETRLLNVPQARVKETDRLRVMHEELAKMGGEVEELEDGLIARHSPLKGAEVSGRGDHRVVMALTVAGLAAQGDTMVDTAESAAVTFPNFVDLMQSLGADVEPIG